MDIEKYNYWCRLEGYEKSKLTELASTIDIESIDDNDLPDSEDEI